MSDHDWAATLGLSRARGFATEAVSSEASIVTIGTAPREGTRLAGSRSPCRALDSGASGEHGDVPGWY